MKDLPDTGLMGRYWRMTDRQSAWFFVAQFAVVYVIGLAIAYALGAGWAALIIGMWPAIIGNLVWAFYNTSKL